MASRRRLMTGVNKSLSSGNMAMAFSLLICLECHDYGYYDILDAEKVKRVIAIGHDWGCFLTWPATILTAFWAVLVCTKQAFGYELYGLHVPQFPYRRISR
ncbi:hypothetical protein AcV7_005412 [Taiwanofungus camphoratus]|nr:hypothetical protein AcV7_005412 [Antrodia cinnamomea]